MPFTECTPPSLKKSWQKQKLLESLETCSTGYKLTWKLHSEIANILTSDSFTHYLEN